VDSTNFDDMMEPLLREAESVIPTLPSVFYNEDGDCIEFLIAHESHYAERVDKLLTVFYGRESGEIVGSLIKGVKRFIAETVNTAPGFAIDVRDGRIRLRHLFTAGMWKEGNLVKARCYQKLRDAAEAMPDGADLIGVCSG
jgi:hypothetical protein